MNVESLKRYGLIAIAAYCCWYYGRGLLPQLKKLITTGGTGTPSLQQATGHVAALIDYFGAVGCKEGVKAARSCGEALFHETHAGEKG